MALFVLSLRNGIVQRYLERPDLDLLLVKEDLLTVVDLATRSVNGRPGPSDQGLLYQIELVCLALRWRFRMCHNGPAIVFELLTFACSAG